MFMFSPEWTGYTKTAVFWQDKEVRYEMTLDDADSCDIPNEVQRSGGFIFVGVIGRSGNVILASKVLVLPINDGTEGGNANTSLTQSLYDQLLANFDSYVKEARSASQTAQVAANEAKNASVNLPYIGDDYCWYVWDTDAGAYINSGVSAKGEKGDKGEDGSDGIDGEDGKDGIGSGDMLKSTYDTDGDGIVDNASALGGASADSYATKEYVLDAIEEAVGIALEGSY